MRTLGARALVSTLAVAATALATTAATGATTAGDAATRWASPSKATITPGVQMLTKGAQCTANFVFADSAGHTYVGYAAHCAGTGSNTDTNGCKTGSQPLGTPVKFEQGATFVSEGTVVGKGKLAYSSWLTEHKLGTKNANTCAYNDLALVRVADAYVRDVNPSVPHWGGPTGLRTSGLSQGDQVYSYGNSELRGGITQTSPKQGIATGDQGGGWSHNVYTLTPGIPGDSGSGFLDSNGRAFGVLSTIEAAPVAGQNALGDLAKELAFAQKHSGIPGLHLVKGTVPFSAGGIG